MKKELKLENLRKTNIFKIPEKYFEELAFHIRQKTSDVSLAEFENLDKGSIFITPEKYFEELAFHIRQKTTEVPLVGLDNIEKTNVFTTPEKYFERLNSTILAKTISAEKPVFSLQITQWSYRIAAGVLVLLMFGYLFEFFQTSENRLLTEVALETNTIFPKTEKIIAEIQKEKEDFSLDKKNSNPTETIQVGGEQIVGEVPSIRSEIVKGLNEIPQEDILAYLNDTETMEEDENLSLLNQQEAIADFKQDETISDEYLLEQIDVADLQEILVKTKL